jgi:WD40 repeat protein
VVTFYTSRLNCAALLYALADLEYIFFWVQKNTVWSSGRTALCSNLYWWYWTVFGYRLLGWDNTSMSFFFTNSLHVCVYVIVLHQFIFSPQIWDLETETCVQTLEGHTDRISCVYRHPELPVLLTGSHDGTVRTWNSDTYWYRALFVCYMMISVRYNKGFEKSFPILFKLRENN